VVQDGEFKYVDYPDQARLYRLPDEHESVADAFPEAGEELDAALEEWLDTEGQPAGRGEAIEADEEIQSRLADLGYLDHEM